MRSSARTSSTGAAASTRRWARTRRCSPISCGASSRTAPTARSSIASSIPPSASRRWSSIPWRRRSKAAARRTPIFRCPSPSCLGAAIRAASTSPTMQPRDVGRGACGGVGAARAAPIVATAPDSAPSAVIAVANPADRDDIVGSVIESSTEDVARAVAIAAGEAAEGGRTWSATPAAERAACLDRAADLLEQERSTFVALAVREAGKTVANGISEVREAVDFLRYYAAQARAELGRLTLRRSGLVQWHFSVEFSAGDLHGRSGRRAGGRQSGAREAGRADAADRPRGGAPVASRGRSRGCAAVPAWAWRDRGRRSSAIRASPA